jgi:hypothetical protein
VTAGGGGGAGFGAGPPMAMSWDSSGVGP